MKYHTSHHYSYLNPIPSWIFFFTLLRIFLGWPIVSHLFKFSPKKYQTCSASSSIVCFFHGIPITYLTYTAMKMSGKFPEVLYNPLLLNLPLSEFEDDLKGLFSTVMSYSSGYMLYDLLFMIVNAFYYPVSEEPNFYDFIQHHLGCILYMYSISYYSTGPLGLMLLIFLGEVTNAFQNIINIAKTGIEQSEIKSFRYKICKKVEVTVQPFFGIFFAFIRLILGPILVIYFGYVYAYHNVLILTKKERDVPASFGVIWVVAILAMVVGSANFAVSNFERSMAILREEGKGKRG
ncbi:hypothetical protein TrLO_g7537 [Triparma laevis f. longispina]|uniref:TLC domain-containing protein n=1 Tax=Triparma laevis f. longispina TaxID=1714387 RepID=A0A9W7CJJ8_9STRA|nr:hypothetical protein TrLO_g7537 [Triparma laevis f. longispina]